MSGLLSRKNLYSIDFTFDNDLVVIDKTDALYTILVLLRSLKKELMCSSFSKYLVVSQYYRSYVPSLSILIFKIYSDCSILDLYCTNKPGLVKSICNIPGFASEDHEFLVVDSWVKPEVLKKAPRKFHKWSKSDWSTMRTDTKSWANEWLKSSVTQINQENYTSFCKHIQSLISKYVPHGFTKTKKDIPWLTPDLKLTCRRERRLYKRAKKSKKPHHWESYKRCSSKCKKDLRRAHWQHLNNIQLTSETEENPKPFWSHIKAQKQDSTGVAPLKYKNQLSSGAIDRAAILSNRSFCYSFARVV